jgi:hypothetical protein
MWCPKKAACTIGDKQIQPRLALIASLDTDGNVFFALTQSITNSEVMLLFMSSLARKLDSELPFWRDNTVFLLDGAKYHTSIETKDYLKKLKL